MSKSKDKKIRVLGNNNSKLYILEPSISKITEIEEIISLSMKKMKQKYTEN